MASGVRQILLNPKIKAMQYPYWKKDCPGEQKSPGGGSKTGKYVGQPRTDAKQPNDVCHIAPSERNRIIHIVKPFRISLGLSFSRFGVVSTVLFAFAF